MSDVNYEQIWESVWGDMQKYGPVHRHHRRIFDRMIDFIPKDDIRSVADIGCGEGSNLLHLHKRFPKAHLFGFDISQTAIEKARTLVDATFAMLDIQSQPLPQKFDFVICSDVIEHLPDDRMALQHIYQATEKFALIATVQGRMRDFEKSIGHVRSYDYGALQRLLEEVGFKTVQMVEWGFPFYSPLYRDLFTWMPAAENASHGRYGWGKRMACQALYVLFSLNRHNRGDIVFSLVAP
jgi:SAM-dependent methyltransferase